MEKSAAFISWHRDMRSTKELFMKKILVILGGGRPKGNTRQLVNAFAQGAVDAGHDVEILSLIHIWNL